MSGKIPRHRLSLDLSPCIRNLALIIMKTIEPKSNEPPPKAIFQIGKLEQVRGTNST